MAILHIAGSPAVPGEALRLEALRALHVLDTAPEAEFDDLAKLAATICQAPIALVSLVDEDRQWFKASCGLDAQETPREGGFCSHAIEESGLFEVSDAKLDPTFAAHPLVTGEPHIRFYAGVPLSGSQGYRYGMLCVIDTKPRLLTEVQRDALTRLAHRASDALETRRLKRIAEDRESTLAHLLEAMPNGVVTCDAAGLLGEFNLAARNWHGVDPRALPPEQWATHFDLYCPDGDTLLPIDQIPLLRALRGEQVREATIVIRAAGQPPRIVRCNGEQVLSADGTLLGAVCVMHDVTRLMAAEEAARLESEQFADAFDAAAQGMALVSLEGRWLEINDALCNMFGYTRDELLDIDFQTLTHPDDLQSDLELVNDLLTGRKQRYQLEKRYFHRSGAIIHAHLSVSLVHDESGQPLHFVSQVQDFTQRYLAERSLRESEEKLRSVIEHTHDAFVACDDSGAVIEWNPAAEVTFGWRKSEVVGRLLDEVIVPPRLREAHRAGMDRFLQTGESRVLGQRLQLPGWHRAGYEFPLELSISLLQVGERQVFSAFLHDITARVQLTDSLKATATQLRTITDNVPALIAHVGPDRRFRFVNRAYGAFFGRDPEALVGQHMRDVLRPEHYELVEPKITEVQAGEEVSFDVDVRDQISDVRHMRVIYIPEERPFNTDADGNTDGEPRSFHLMARDQTADVRLSRMLRDRVLLDELTGLPNRAAWNEALESAIARAERAGEPVVVMFLDLDGFKLINDAHGHAAGDHVLCEFAAALRETVRTEDMVARLSGDEFVVLLDRVADVDVDPSKIAAKILQRLASGTTFEGQHLPIQPSIGIGIQRGPIYDAVALMRCADEEMYAVKRTHDQMPQARDCDLETEVVDPAQ